jgi:hypothetical protein
MLALGSASVALPNLMAPQLVKRPQAQSTEYRIIDGRELPPGSTAMSGTSKSRLLSDWSAFRKLYRVAHRYHPPACDSHQTAV